MIIISHRGNLNGPSALENSPDYIFSALDKGFEVEVDVWRVNNQLYLGHDFLQYETTLDFLSTKGLWVHCKNLEALNLLSKYKGINCFAHKNDDFTISSHGYILLPPHMGFVKNCITMMPELNKSAKIADGCAGIITDFAANY